jgi:hypothetical protein
LLIPPELDEETSLVLSSIENSLGRIWSTKKLRDYANGETKRADGVWEELSRLGVFQYMLDEDDQKISLLNEILGARLLPGILSLTLAATRFVKGAVASVEEGIAKGKLKLSFSSSEIVPEANMADAVVIGNTLYWKESLELKSILSPDESMKLYKVTPVAKGEKLSIRDANESMSVLIPQIIGGGEQCVKLAVEYAKTRFAFGKPIGSYQAIKHKLVDDAISLEMCRSYYFSALQDKTLLRGALNYVFKKVRKVESDTIQVHGGLGFTNDLDVHLHLRRCIAIYKAFAN